MNYGISGCWNTHWCGHPRLMPVPAPSVTAQRSRLSNISKAQLCQRHVILIKTPRKGFKLNISWSGEVYWAMSLPGAARRSKGKGKNNQKCGGRDWINVLPPGSPVTTDDAGGLIVTIWILAQTNTMSGPWQQEHGHWFWWQPAPLTSVTASHTTPSCLLTALLPPSQLLLSFLIKKDFTIPGKSPSFGKFLWPQMKHGVENSSISDSAQPNFSGLRAAGRAGAASEQKETQLLSLVLTISPGSSSPSPHVCFVFEEKGWSFSCKSRTSNSSLTQLTLSLFSPEEHSSYLFKAI